MSHETPSPRVESHETTGFLERTFAEHHAPLLRYATRLFSGDVDRARDAVQDTFVKLMNERGIDASKFLPKE